MSHRLASCRIFLFTIVLGMSLLIIGVTRTQAADHASDCRRRIHNAEQNLKKAVDRHGEHSTQAEKRRHELEEARRGCEEEHPEH